MQFFIFKSQTRSELRAFAAESGGSKLPAQYGPWLPTGVVRADKDPPHQFSRDLIERAIASEGFQLWRVKSKKTS